MRLVQMYCMGFEMSERLAKGGFDLGSYLGVRVLLKNNALYPWFVLVPEVESGVEELTDLSEDEYGDVMKVVYAVSVFVRKHFGVEKVNVGCVGIVVRQLHLHVVGRSEGDAAWPGVVWGSGDKREYDDVEVERIRGVFEAENFGGILVR